MFVISVQISGSKKKYIEQANYLIRELKDTKQELDKK